MEDNDRTSAHPCCPGEDMTCLSGLAPGHFWLWILLPSPCRFLNKAMKMFDATEVVPINFVFFTASAILAGTTKLSVHLAKHSSKPAFRPT